MKLIEPAFGLDATWIYANKKEEAIMSRHTAVDPATVLSPHMSDLVKKYADEFLNRQDSSEVRWVGDAC